MSEEFEKLGRKRSADPAQESLRQAKDDWNQEVKALIAGLIAFKQGMNGRGNPKAGIPPSAIKDPLPPQMGQYLSGIATQYSKMVDEAKKIIDAQAYYSAHRRKSKPKVKNTQNLSTQAPANETVPKAASIEPSLIVQASWWGSRTWAYFALLKKINNHNRRLRLNMLATGLALRKRLKHFEYNLAERDPNSAPAALTTLSEISLEYVNVFLRAYDKLKDIYEVKSHLPESTAPKGLKSAPEKPPEEQPNQKQTTPSVEQATVPVEVVAPVPAVQTVSNDLREEYKKIYEQYVKIGTVLKHIFALPNIDKSNIKTMKKSLSKFKRDIETLNNLSGRSDHDKSAVELEKLTQDVINQYKYLLQAATTVLGPASNFDELNKKIPTPKISEVLEIMQERDVIRKEAASSVTNWLNKTWMNINPDNVDRMKLEMISSVPAVRQALDSLMNSLENRDAEIEEISKKVSDVSTKFVDLLTQAIALAKHFMISARRQEKGRDHYLADIKISDIRILNELKNDISEYINNG